MSAAGLHAVLERDLRGLFTMPDTIAPTMEDVTWFANRGQIFTNPVAHPDLLPGKPGECWRNAYRAISYDPSLRYVQGLVQGAHSRILIAHAWCVGEGGTLYEPTWDVARATGAEVYLGVVFSLDDLMRLQDVFGRIGWYNGFADVLSRRRTREGH